MPDSSGHGEDKDVYITVLARIPLNHAAKEDHPGDLVLCTAGQQLVSEPVQSIIFGSQYLISLHRFS